MKDKFPYDDILKQRLDAYESEVAGNLFERLMEKREHAEPTSDDIVKHKLVDHISAVPDALFEQIIGERLVQEPSADNVIYNKLTDYATPVPSDMFDNIMKARENNRPKSIWWKNEYAKWAVFILLFLMMLGGYKLWNKYKDVEEIKHHDTVLMPQSNFDNNNNDKSAIKNIEGSVEHGNNSQVSLPLQQTIITESETLSHKSNNNINQINIDKKSTPREISSARINVNKTSIVNKTDFPVSNSTTITSNFSQPTFNPSFSDADGKESSTINLNAVSNSDLPSSKDNLALGYLPVRMKKLVLPSPAHEKVTDALPCHIPDGCPTFSSNKWRKSMWYVDAYGSPEYALRRLEANSLEYNDYKNARDTIEMAQYAFSIGVRVTTLFKNGFLLRGGLVYAQINEKFQKDSFGIGNIRYVIDKNPTTGRLDTVQVDITEGIFRKKRYNHYRSLDFTIQGGYEFPLTNQLTIGINGGMNFNIKTDIKATVLDQNLQPLVVSKDKTIYQNSVGSSAIGALSLYYQFSSQCQLMVEPQFRYYFKPISKSDYVIRQNYTHIGLNIGLRYKL